MTQDSKKVYDLVSKQTTFVYLGLGQFFTGEDAWNWVEANPLASDYLYGVGLEDTYYYGVVGHGSFTEEPLR